VGRILHHGSIGFLSVALVFASSGCTLLQPINPPQLGQTELYLFVQTATSGTLTPLNPAVGLYRLTLQNVSPKVVFFSDRPNRDSGSMPVQSYLDEIFSPTEANPNGALVIELTDGADQLTIALELSEPDYNASASTLSYLVKQLDDVSEGLSHLSYDQLEMLPAQFGNAELFIDSGDYHRCYGQIVNNSSYELGLDRGSLDPAYSNSNNWGDHPPDTIAANGRGDWTFRFHAADHDKTANLDYVGPDSDIGSVELNFYMTCYTYTDALGHQEGKVNYDINSSGCITVSGSIFVITCAKIEHGKGGQQIIYTIENVTLP